MKKLFITLLALGITFTLSFCASGSSRNDGGSMLQNSGNSKYSTSSSSGERTQPTETKTERINREIRELDAKYKKGEISKKKYGEQKAALLQQLFN